MKSHAAMAPVAEESARALPSDRERDLFMKGCGLREGGLDLLDRALVDSRAPFAFADPREDLSRVGAPVVIVHGRSDDVIPWFEAEKLRAALRAGHKHRVLLTGMYDHTSVSSPVSVGANAMFSGVRAMAREGQTMLAIVRAMAAAPRGAL
jgi:pimeloyl-ACP methyl ester carboxylesterase